MKQRSGIVIIMGLLMLALIFYAGVSLSRMNGRIEEALSAKEALADEALALAVSNAALEYEIEHSGDLDMVERVARDKLGLVLPGEIIYYDIGS